jgi:hypothetical protein
LPDAPAQRYLRRFNIGAIYIIAGSAGFPMHHSVRHQSGDRARGSA